MKDPDVAAFIQQESLTPEELNRSISKFNQYITERDKFLRGDTDYIAKGYKPILVMNHGYADVSYEETPELIAAEKEAAKAKAKEAREAKELAARKAKEKEHYDLEDEYLKRKATFTNQYNELYERRDRLARIIEDEASKMDVFLQKGQHSYQDGEQFYRSLQQLMEDSQFACRRREDELQYHEEMLDRDYRKKQDELEQTIGDLRRSYARTIK